MLGSSVVRITQQNDYCGYKTENVFTATLRDAEVSDSGKYWCAVSMSGTDPHTRLDLQVLKVFCAAL